MEASIRGSVCLACGDDSSKALNEIVEMQSFYASTWAKEGLRYLATSHGYYSSHLFVCADDYGQNNVLTDDNQDHDNKPKYDNEGWLPRA